MRRNIWNIDSNMKSGTGIHFNKIVPISGNNQPYDPEFKLYPAEVTKLVAVVWTPAEPEINWNTLPASLNVWDAT